jgi:hypothetical protein
MPTDLRQDVIDEAVTTRILLHTLFELVTTDGPTSKPIAVAAIRAAIGAAEWSEGVQDRLNSFANGLEYNADRSSYLTVIDGGKSDE